MEDNKKIWIELFFTQRQRLLKAKNRFLEIERNEQYEGKSNRQDPLTNSVCELFPLKHLKPTKIIETALAAIDEYIMCLETFSEKEWKAFILGIGCQQIPFHYWGENHLNEYRQEILKTKRFYLELEENTRKDAAYKYKKENPFEFKDLKGIVTSEYLNASEILSVTEALVSSAIMILAKDG